MIVAILQQTNKICASESFLVSVVGSIIDYWILVKAWEVGLVWLIYKGPVFILPNREIIRVH